MYQNSEFVISSQGKRLHCSVFIDLVAAAGPMLQLLGDIKDAFQTQIIKDQHLLIR